MRLVIAAFLVALPSLAFAQQDYPRDITLSWENATFYVDGSVIATGDLINVGIECFRHDDTVTPVFTDTVPANGEGLPQTELFTAVIPNPGTYTCFGYSIVVGGIYSDASDPALKKFVGKPEKIKQFTFN